MATFKRRVIYLTDDEWTELQELAHERRVTISSLVREALVRPAPKTKK